jgi:quercetin dioxygenase-like cupin family protein
VVTEAQLRATKNDLVPDGRGWFVVNARESRWRDGGPLGVYCTFEGRQRFSQLGITLNVLEPGQPMAMYHRENAQEGFLVVSGECMLVVEGEQRRLVAWDFFHCPSGTEHVIVGSGNAPSVVLAVGGRGRGVGGGVVYRVCAAAAKFGASVERETADPREAYGKAYAGLPRSKWIAYADRWLPEY